MYQRLRERESATSVQIRAAIWSACSRIAKSEERSNYLFIIDMILTDAALCERICLWKVTLMRVVLAGSYHSSTHRKFRFFPVNPAFAMR